MGAAFETSVPLVLMEASGKGFLWRSTWSVSQKDGPGGAPFLLSRSQMANLHVILVLGADSVAVKTPSGKPAALAAGTSFRPPTLGVRPGILAPRGARSAVLRPASRRVLCARLRFPASEERPGRPFGPAESRREDTFLARHPGAFAIGEGS